MELEILRHIQLMASPIIDAFFIGITQLGEEVVYIMILTYIYWNINKKFGKYLGFATMVTLVINNGMKEFFDFQRPIGEAGIRSLRIETATGKSFPSGHSQSAATFYTAISIGINKKWVKALCAVIMTLVGFSRMYLGLHYPKDVIFGLLLGIATAYGVYWLLNQGLKHLYLYLGIVLFSIAIIPIGLGEDYYKSFGLLLGFIVGIILEEKYVDFKVEANLVIKIGRFFIGLIIILLIKSGLKMILPERMVFDLFRYWLIAFFGIGLYPMTFRKFRYNRKSN